MDRTPLKSSVVASKGYNPLTKSMEVEFQKSAGKAMWEFRKAGYAFERGEK